MSPRRNHARLAVALLALISVFAGCAKQAEEPESVSTGTTIAIDAAAVVVSVTTAAFEPATVRIKAGEAVGWRFVDRALMHNVVGEDFRSPLKRGGWFTHAFAEPGSYSYHCTLHPSMKGTVEVD